MSLINRLFNKNKYDRRCYAITHGKYKGSFFVYMYHDEEKFCFIWGNDGGYFKLETKGQFCFLARYTIRKKNIEKFKRLTRCC